MKGKLPFALFATLLMSPIAGECADQPPSTLKQATATVSIPANTMADQWVAHRTEPLAQQQAEEAKKKKHPVKNICKALAANYHQSMADMGKDLAFVFTASDWDPYNKTSAPVDKPAIILELNLVDGSTAYIWRFPDDSFAIQGSYLDNSVIVPIKGENNEFIIKYTNGLTGRVVRKGSTTTIYRPDNTVTTVEKSASGDYRISNDKIGYMGEAHADPTGVQYELGSWTRQNDQD